MKFVLLVLGPIIVAILVGKATNSWIWGIVSFPVAMFVLNRIAVWLFGYPSEEEVRRMAERPVKDDFSKEELKREVAQIKSKLKADAEACEPTKHEIIWEIIEANSGYLQRLALRPPDGARNIESNPFKPSASTLITNTIIFSHGIFDTEAVEEALKELLQDEYGSYYEATKKRIISRH